MQVLSETFGYQKCIDYSSFFARQTDNFPYFLCSQKEGRVRTDTHVCMGEGEKSLKLNFSSSPSRGFGIAEVCYMSS